MLQNVKRGKLQDLAKEQIKSLIVDSGLKSGDCLPTESKLAEQLGISKTTVREALKALENVGILEARHGIGNFVKAFSYDVILENLPYSLHTDVHSIQEIVEIRECLEANFLIRDIGKFTHTDVDDLWAIYGELEKTNSADRLRDAIEAHSAFHCALYRHSGNRLLIKLIELFSTLQRNLLFANRYWTTDPDSFLAQHRAIIEAIERKNPRMVPQIMGRHFADVMGWLAREKDGRASRKEVRRIEEKH